MHIRVIANRLRFVVIQKINSYSSKHILGVHELAMVSKNFFFLENKVSSITL